MIQPKRIHEFTEATDAELALTPVWFEAEVPDGAGGFRNRKVPKTKIGGGGGSGSDAIIDCGERTVGNELIDLGQRV